MLFTQNQISEILKIIDSNTVIYIASTLSTDILTESDKYILKNAGIDPKKLYTEFSPFMQSYYFGRLSLALGDERTKTLEYHDFLKYLQKGQYVPMTPKEENMYTIAQNRTYIHLKGLGETMKQTVNGIIIEEDQKKRLLYEKIIHDEIATGIQERKSLANIVLAIGNKTGDWQRNLGRIVQTEYNNIFQEGRAAEIYKKYGGDALVYKNVFDKACRFCIKAYLTRGSGSQPRVFKLGDLVNNGTNIGVKSDNYLPIIGSHHPYCFDKETDVLTKDGWKNWQNVIGNELFLSVNPETMKIEWVNGVGLIKYQYTGKMSFFKGRSFNLMTTPNHKHFIKNNTKLGNSFTLIDELEFGSRSSFVNAVDGWDSKSPQYMQIGKYKINFQDYCKLMAWWLSDGSISYNKNRNRWEFKITQQNTDKHYLLIESLLIKIFDIVWSGKDALFVPMEENEAKYFIQFGHSFDKFIPEEIKNATKNDIDLFLDTYRNGDGSTRKSRIRVINGVEINSKEEIYYTTSSPKIASDIGELLIKIGSRPSYYVTKPKLTKFKNGSYLSKHDQINIYKTSSKSSSLLKIQQIKVDYDDFVYDVELERNHTLFVRRGGKVTISGNCRCQLHILFPGMVWDKDKKEFRYPENKISKREYYDKITVGDKVFYV